jgi:hypothetical protein
VRILDAGYWIGQGEQVHLDARGGAQREKQKYVGKNMF